MPNYKLQKTGLTISLTDKDYIGEGGEGKVYAKNNIAYKIGSTVPNGKINELLKIKTQYILTPEDQLLQNNKPVGYSMALAPLGDCWIMPLTFTTTFWNREGIKTEDALKIVSFLRSQFAFIHSKKCLLVDANPYNFLIHKSFNNAYLIDTNSFQTESYPATSIMTCIRDRQAKCFTELSDWFSFAIVTFELLTGISPFRGGSYPGIDGDAETRMFKRMDANISVLNKKVKFPKNAVRPFSSIPQNYLDWYSSLFEQGNRCPPPADFIGLTHVAKTATTRDSVKLKVKEIFVAAEDILSVKYIDGKQIVVTKNYIYIDDNELLNRFPTKNLFFHNRQLHSVDGSLYNITTQTKVEDGSFPNATIINGVAYYKYGDSLRSMNFLDMGGKTLTGTPEVAKVMPNTTIIGDGFICHNMAGSNYFIGLPDGNRSYQVRVKELDGHQILDGKGFGQTVVVFTKKGGFTAKCKIIFNESYDSYDFTSEPCDLYDYQGVLLDNGILVETTPEGSLSLTRGNNKKIIEDDFLTSSLFNLYSFNNSVILSRENKLIEISLK